MTTVTTTTELKIEAVTRIKRANDAYAGNVLKDVAGGSRMIPVSVPRVRWLERPIVHAEPRRRG